MLTADLPSELAQQGVEALLEQATQPSGAANDRDTKPRERQGHTAACRRAAIGLNLGSPWRRWRKVLHAVEFEPVPIAVSLRTVAGW